MLTIGTIIIIGITARFAILFITAIIASKISPMTFIRSACAMPRAA